MIKVDQRSDSDCLHACVASIFELSHYECPDFGKDLKGADDAGLRQDTEFRKWLALRGLSMLNVANPATALAGGAKSVQSPWGYCIAGGKSPRGDWDHAIVYQVNSGDGLNPRMVHDPHESRAGFDGPPTYFTCFLLIDPALFWKHGTV